MDKPEALFLADELEAPLGTVIGAELYRRAAEELRRLHAENGALKKAVALLQQHHATAWNRGHMMGMKANEDTARRALDAVKQDAWGNTQLTEALLKAEEQRDALLEALKLAWPIIEKEKFMQDGCYGKNFIQSKAERARKAYEAARAAIKAVEETK